MYTIIGTLLQCVRTEAGRLTRAPKVAANLTQLCVAQRDLVPPHLGGDASHDKSPIQPPGDREMASHSTWSHLLHV